MLAVLARFIAIAATLLMTPSVISGAAGAQTTTDHDASAQDEALAAALACRETSDARERLACLDRTLDTLARLRPELVATPSPATAGRAPDAADAADPLVSRAQPARADPAQTPSAPDADAPEPFGAEDLPENRQWRDDGPREIQTRALRIDTSPRGSLIFTLENGHVWRQISADSAAPYIRRSDDGYAVTIRRAAFGSYRLKIEGVRQSIRVRRIE